MLGSLLKKILASIIALIQLACGVGAYSPQVKLTKATQIYPYVFVHGFSGWGYDDGLSESMPYWGGANGNLVTYFNSIGCECYDSSCGAFSSAWDRACELYAQLTGTRVDYGKAHAEKYGHDRYGKTYSKPLFEGWGKEKKVNFIAHSFGGNTVRLLSTLLAKGSQEEQQVTKDGSLSSLFAGGHGGWIFSITTLASPHNGTTLTDVLQADPGSPVLAAAYTLFTAINREPIQTVFDFDISQWHSGEAIQNLKRLINTPDNGVYDLTLHGSAELNRFIETQSDIYYYSYAGCCTKAVGKQGHHVPTLDRLASAPMASAIGSFKGKALGGEIEVDESWYPNDGIVNTVSALHPSDEAFCIFNADTVKQGIWQVMPTQRFAHQGFTSGNGTSAKDANELIDFFITQINLISSTYIA
ncbi:MAG TPA: hypothetical protein DDY98_04560 [Ruminococcaceae bacterium]|nr:hypothetical protein [Oscillospiraceae bacterium]